jgi:lipid II:glycine glycyltransferase (peptidoglycan interpeptide bridge formation enzyme)
LLLRVLPNVFDNYEDSETICSAFSEVSFQRTSSPHQTLFLDLRPSLDELRRGLDHKWRTNLNGAERTSVRLREGTDRQLFDRFVPVYEEMHARKGYPPDIHIDRYAAMQEHLPESLKPRIILAEHDDKAVAGGVFSVLGETATWILGATSDDGLKLKAAYLIQWRAIEWMKEKGYRQYDVGGVAPDKVPGTYRFKSKLCGKHPRICTRIGEFTACESRVSRLAVRAGESLRYWKRRAKEKYAPSK